MKLNFLLSTRHNSFNNMGPVKKYLNDAKECIKNLSSNKLWYCGGIRSAAIAAELLRTGKIIALPTDTIYGFAGLAQDDHAISRLYEIKKRDLNKPLAICLNNINDIKSYAHAEHLPNGLTLALLPGPTTIILRRKGILNSSLNPGNDKIGIRIPDSKFVCSVIKLLNEPIALTSANESNQRSTLHPSEFENLWHELDGIFYEKVAATNLKNCWRKGSTIVDLSVKGEFQIVRKGIGFNTTMRFLKLFHLKNTTKQNEIKQETSIQEQKELFEIAAANVSG